MGGAAEAVEAVRVGIGVEARDLDFGDARGTKPVGDIGRQVEVRLALRTGDEEALVRGVRVEEAATEALVYFIGWLGDAGTDRGADAVAAGPQLFHGCDGRVGDAADGPAPARVRCPD